MKRFVLIMMIMLCASIGWAGDTIYERSATITSLGTDAASSSLLEIDMSGEAGIILSIACDGGNSDDFDIYIYDNDMDGTSTQGNWYTDSSRDNETILIFDYASAITSWRDDDPISFSCDDSTNPRSLYLGVYNDDPSLTATINCKTRYKLNKNKELGAVTTEWTE